MILLRYSILTIGLLLTAFAWSRDVSWQAQESLSKASLRGLFAVDASNVWASGTGGTVLHTRDAGQHWLPFVVPESKGLDFRDVKAVSPSTAFLLSSGEGDLSRIYKTEDSGVTWRLLFRNAELKGFFDALAFWDEQHGIVLGDPVNGHFTIMITQDGGATWTREPGPIARAEEGAFAASGSCLLARGTSDVWFASGGVRGARVFHSRDRGRTWTIVQTPVRHEKASQGIFSIAFADEMHGLVVGGDYSKPSEPEHNLATTSDGGISWREPDGAHPSGYRSAAAYLASRHAWLVAGTTGSDISFDGGKSWTGAGGGELNTMTVIGSDAWAAGKNGLIERLQLH